MKSYYQDPPNYIWNDRIALYKTSDSKKNSNWFYRFTNPMTRTGYIRKSTRTNDFGEASSKAIAHYTELELRGRFGAVTEHTTIRLLLKTFGDEVTSSVLRHWNLCYQAYWKPYWAKRDLFNVTDDDIKQYIKWRTDAKNIKYTRYGKNKKHGNWIDINDRTISVETLRKDLRGLKYLFKRAFSKKMIANAPHFPRLKQNTMNVVDLPDQQKRARLTEEQAIAIKAWRQSFRSRWINVIKIEKKALDKPIPTSFIHRNWRYNNIMFYMGISLALSTGIRPAEIKKIKWKDVKRYVDGDKEYSVIMIRKEVSKTGKFRDSISNDFERTVVRLDDWKYEWERKFNREPAGEDWVFPSEKDYTKHKSTWHHVIRNGLKRIDDWGTVDDRNYPPVSFNSDNDLKIKKWITLYSFRSRHITLMIRSDVSPYILSRNIGSSTEMIDKYYNVNRNIEHREEFTKHIHKLMTRDSE
tara:strand:+ start:478 stop:1881 length:1404 start_codon:yes stop_codon:yes gene_type:complete